MADTTFPPVFVINLERSADRRAEMAALLDPLHIGYTFFTAVDGRALDLDALPDYDRTRRRLFFGRDLSQGEVGCLLSHRAVFRHMVENNIPHAVVLEDDVTVAADFAAVIRDLAAAPVAWDVVRFLAYEKVQNAAGRDICALPTKPYMLSRIPTLSGGAYGYMLNLKAAKIFLHHMQKNAVPVDTLQGYVWKTGLETFVLRPSPVSSDPGNASTIGNTRFDKSPQLGGWQKAVYPLTRAWLKLSQNLGRRLAYLAAARRDKKTAVKNGL
ncbi:MAG: glycosyltransferase family 25 protein [Alphaproteobacteria bacterium]|nr:glycosyltransferase family 25 protein [Alphaproteobacteria bacterium]MDE2336556.1 glycosyltransferase family 25 protein [Alphaproteobacteria bacterium]